MNFGVYFYYIDMFIKKVWFFECVYQLGFFGFVDGVVLMSWKGFWVGSDKEIFGFDNEFIYQIYCDIFIIFQVDVLDGWYEVIFYFVEVYSKFGWEKLVYNFGVEGNEVEVVVDCLFYISVNGERVCFVV